jgi:hypothetical protein
VLRKTGCTLFAFLCTALINYKFCEFPSLSAKIYHAKEIELWLKNHPNRVSRHYQIIGLVGKAYLKSATAAITADVFRKTGLFPANRYIFDEHDPGRISVQYHESLAGYFCAMFQNCRRITYH